MILRRLLLVLLVFGLLTPSWADIPDIENRVVQHTCPNGITLLIMERHFSPTVSCRMMFRTGSVDESSGKTGLAHMFEHMMFKGTHTLGTRNYAAEAPLLDKIDQLHRSLDTEKAKGDKADQNLIAQLIDQIDTVEKQESQYIVVNELWNLYEREGASDLNASTSPDFTQYQVDLPSNKLELWAILDSDRIKNPVFREFYQEREVVKEERRMRVDTNPEGKLYENLLETAYSEHPYRHPTIGWEADLNHLNVEDLKEFYHRFYTPDRLTIAVVGDIKAADVIQLVDRYFGNWKTGPSAMETITPEPPQSGQRVVNVQADAQPRFLMAFHSGTYPDPDDAVYYAIGQLLGHGNTSRLYKELVEKRQLASAVDVSQDYPGERYPPLMIIDATPRFPNTVEDVQKAVWTELARLQKAPIQPAELEKIRASLQVDILNTLQTNAGMASTLDYNQTIHGDWKYIIQFQKKLQTLTSADIQRVAKRILIPTNCTIAILQPIAKAKNPRMFRTEEAHP